MQGIPGRALFAPATEDDLYKLDFMLTSKDVTPLAKAGELRHRFTVQVVPWPCRRAGGRGWASKRAGKAVSGWVRAVE